MNTKILNFFLIFISISLYSQNHRFIYEYSFKMDSLNKNFSEKELMNLDISKEGSNFYSNDKFISDSLTNAEFKKAEAIKSTNINIDLGKIMKNPKVGYSITKKYPDFQTVLHTSISGDPYAIEENEKITWKILPETKEIEGIKVQKATTNFIGRNWIAWFADELQFQDGPYKFYGLPGLILSLEDVNGDHIFKFVGSRKLNYSPVLHDDLGEKEFLISPKKFKELWKEYLNDPSKKMRQLLSDSSIQLKMYDASGKELSPSEIIRNKEKQAKERVKKTNNFLDLKLYK